MKKLITLFIVLLISVTTFAQDKATENATKQIEQLNEKLVTGNPAAKLTDIQKKDLLVLFMATNKELNQIRKNVSDKDEKQTQVKAVYAAQAKKMNSEILTKEQLKAKKIGNEKLKK